MILAPVKECHLHAMRLAAHSPRLPAPHALSIKSLATLCKCSDIVSLLFGSNALSTAKAVPNRLPSGE
jgi:hypothetical protein